MKKKNVLIIEDQIELLTLLAESLASIVNVDTCSSLETSEALIRATTLDLIIADVHLGDGKSHDTLSRLLKTQKQFPFIIYISGEVNIDNKLKSLKSGGIDFIAKPFDVRELVQKVRIHLNA